MDFVHYYSGHHLRPVSYPEALGSLHLGSKQMQAELQNLSDTATRSDLSRRTTPAGQSGKWGYFLLHLILIVVGITALIPFVWMVATSLKGATEVLSATPTFWPQ